ncbi:PREDICTED: chymotrypsin-2-like [Ceratosolen solmsi marchali]|uniref:Chymotrypsin-2-like n=1 Tax=Ceratosolen solmsi marchali TaxID=326594 RepID=A0AAJ7E2S2_9HYME|nr:PREDICTED: chymotrypsin-2-like [Ceratosolen solmsi marchali]
MGTELIVHKHDRINNIDLGKNDNNFKELANAKIVKVVGGENAVIRDFPYIASLRQHNERHHFCGGVIISNRHIITAAHCVYDIENDGFKVYVGTSNSSLFSIPFYNVKNVKMHPEFIGKENTEWKLYNDIAIITVDPCIKFNEFQNKIKLPTSNIGPDNVGVIIGWGKISYPIGIPYEILQKATTKTVSNAECAVSYPNSIRNEQICVYEAPGIGTCHGDSGGPFVINGTLIGISSYSKPCALGHPDVYTRIYSYLDFIASTTKSWKKYLPCLT